MLRIIFSTDKLSFLPILIFDKNILNEKVLLAIDDPESSMRAVDFLTTTLSGFDFKIRNRSI